MYKEKERKNRAYQSNQTPPLGRTNNFIQDTVKFKIMIIKGRIGPFKTVNAKFRFHCNLCAKTTFFANFRVVRSGFLNDFVRVSEPVWY